MTTASDLSAKITVGDANLRRLDSAVNSDPGTWDTRFGVTVDNFRKRLDAVGYYVPVVHESGLSVTNARFTVIEAGQVYAANPGEVPFTTTGTFDASKWVVNPTLTEAQRLNPGATFNVLWYIWQQPGGPAQVDLITAGDYASQDSEIVTNGIQAAWVAWWESGASGAVETPPGQYLVKDSPLNGVTGGKAVCKHIFDSGFPDETGNQQITVSLISTGAERFLIDGTFRDSQFEAGNFPDKVFWRFDMGDGNGKPFNGIVGQMPKVYWVGTYDDRHKCPMGTKLRNINGSNLSFGSNGPRGDVYEWPGTGILIDGASNSEFYGVRVRAGHTPLNRDVYNDPIERFSYVASTGVLTHNAGDEGDTNAFGTGTTITGRPTSFADSLMLLADSDTSADKHLVKIATKTDVRNAVLEATMRPAIDLSDFHAAYGFPVCNVREGSNVITIAGEGHARGDMVGKLIFVEAERDNLSDTGVTLAYISAVDEDANTMTLVGNDGAPVDWAADADDVTWWLGGGLVVARVYNAEYNGKNDDLAFYGAAAEKCGGIQTFLQVCSGVALFAGKGHARDGMGNTVEQDFTRSGLCYGFDRCEQVEIYSSKITWANYIDRSQERVFSMKAWGDQNAISFRDCEVFGGANVWDVINVSQAGGNNCIRWDGGEMRADGWKASDVDHNLVGGIAGSGLSKVANMVAVGLPMYVKQSGAADGFRDALGIYRNTLREEDVSVVSGAVTVEEGNLIVIEASGASTDVDTINGLHDGKTGIITLSDSANDVVLKDGIGNIQTSDSLDLTLGQQRKHVRYLFQDGKVRIDSATSA